VKKNEKLETAIAQRSATEYFQKDIIFDISDVLIVVVNDLTYHDQSFILSLAKMLPNNGNQKQLFIVHNFKDCYDYDEALVLWRKQVLNPFKIK